MGNLVAVGLPQRSSIPALGVDMSKLATDQGIRRELQSLTIPHRCRIWLDQYLTDGTVTALSTRNHLPPRTLILTDWLDFDNPADRDAFMSAFPVFNPQRRVDMLRHDVAAARAKLDQKLARGDFDLKGLGPQHRVGLARKYVRLTEELAELERRIEAAELIFPLQAKWQKILA